jgi:lipoyl(octanoyl) transferase
MTVSTLATVDTHAQPGVPPPICEYQDLGRMAYGPAWDLQRELVTLRKKGSISDRLLLVEHPHVVSMGRNAKEQNVLLPREFFDEKGIDYCETDRGGDVTYHGPGQIIGYPILDLKDWKRDIIAFIRALEQVMIDTVAEFGVSAGRLPGASGIWVGDAKLGALGVHISRWVTSHGFALNVSTDLDYYGYIVPCGLMKPVTSMERLLGEAPPEAEVKQALVKNFGRVFQRELREL